MGRGAGSRLFSDVRGCVAVSPLNRRVPCKDDTLASPPLRKKRGSLASEMVQLERQLRHRKEALGYVDATLRLLDPTVEIDAIPNRRIVKRIRLFRQGELGRMILKVLRNADTPLSTRDITNAILAAGGHGDEARSAVMPRVTRRCRLWRFLPLPSDSAYFLMQSLGFTCRRQ